MRSRLAGIVALFGAFFMVIGTGLTFSAASAEPKEKIYICHELGTGGLNGEAVAPEAINKNPNGHDTHGQDIIPPFDGYAGKNWDTAGRAIYDNGCEAPDGNPEPDPDPEPVVIQPAAPTHNDECGTEDDTYTVPATEGVDYFVESQLAGAGDYQGEGSVTVTAQAQDGYVVTGQTSWTLEFDDEPCPQSDVEVQAAAPRASDECGTADDTYTVPATEGVDYVVGNQVVSADTYPSSGSVLVTAQAQDGYVLTGQTSWQLDFTDEACEDSDVPTPGGVVEGQRR